MSVVLAIVFSLLHSFQLFFLNLGIFTFKKVKLLDTFIVMHLTSLFKKKTAQNMKLNAIRCMFLHSMYFSKIRGI